MAVITNEDIFAAQVAILEKLLEAAEQKKGHTRFGGYTRDALILIERTKEHIQSPRD
ncbi:hypothetical protein [Pannonibacter indicus]|jgi:hypothetical protein|uniref:hypothetical protein n=1 Tax=Pannonibacter indicus TaxID=466044 RepID=UPI0039198B4A